MTVLWTALIVVGAVMIAVAVWPSIRGRDRPAPPADRPGEGPDRPGEDPDGAGRGDEG